MRLLHTMPAAPLWLGLAGLLPFVAAALAILLPVSPWHEVGQRALLAYGAVILSFLGGVRWGLAMAASSAAKLFGRLGLSVVPSLVGWVALLLPPAQGLVLLALGFGLMLWADLRLAEAPCWYRQLRLPLSAGAISALLLGLLG